MPEWYFIKNVYTHIFFSFQSEFEVFEAVRHLGLNSKIFSIRPKVIRVTLNLKHSLFPIFFLLDMYLCSNEIVCILQIQYLMDIIVSAFKSHELFANLNKSWRICTLKILL